MMFWSHTFLQRSKSIITTKLGNFGSTTTSLGDNTIFLDTNLSQQKRVFKVTARSSDLELSATYKLEADSGITFKGLNKNNVEISSQKKDPSGNILHHICLRDNILNDKYITHKQTGSIKLVKSKSLSNIIKENSFINNNKTVRGTSHDGYNFNKKKENSLKTLSLEILHPCKVATQPTKNNKTKNNSPFHMQYKTLKTRYNIHISPTFPSAKFKRNMYKRNIFLKSLKRICLMQASNYSKAVHKTKCEPEMQIIGIQFKNSDQKCNVSAWERNLRTEEGKKLEIIKNVPIKDKNVTAWERNKNYSNSKINFKEFAGHQVIKQDKILKLALRTEPLLGNSEITKIEQSVSEGWEHDKNYEKAKINFDNFSSEKMLKQSSSKLQNDVKDTAGVPWNNNKGYTRENITFAQFDGEALLKKHLTSLNVSGSFVNSVKQLTEEKMKIDEKLNSHNTAEICIVKDKGNASNNNKTIMNNYEDNNTEDTSRNPLQLTEEKLEIDEKLNSQNTVEISIVNDKGNQSDNNKTTMNNYENNTEDTSRNPFHSYSPEVTEYILPFSAKYRPKTEFLDVSNFETITAEMKNNKSSDVELHKNFQANEAASLIVKNQNTDEKSCIYSYDVTQFPLPYETPKDKTKKSNSQNKYNGKSLATMGLDDGKHNKNQQTQLFSKTKSKKLMVDSHTRVVVKKVIQTVNEKGKMSHLDINTYVTSLQKIINKVKDKQKNTKIRAVDKLSTDNKINNTNFPLLQNEIKKNSIAQIRIQDNKENTQCEEHKGKDTITKSDSKSKKSVLNVPTDIKLNKQLNKSDILIELLQCKEKQIKDTTTKSDLNNKMALSDISINTSNRIKHSKQLDKNEMSSKNLSKSVNVEEKKKELNRLKDNVTKQNYLENNKQKECEKDRKLNSLTTKTQEKNNNNVYSPMDESSDTHILLDLDKLAFIQELENYKNKLTSTQKERMKMFDEQLSYYLKFEETILGCGALNKDEAQIMQSEKQKNFLLNAQDKKLEESMLDVETQNTIFEEKTDKNHKNIEFGDNGRTSHKKLSNIKSGSELTLPVKFTKINYVKQHQNKMSKTERKQPSTSVTTDLNLPKEGYNKTSLLTNINTKNFPLLHSSKCLLAYPDANNMLIRDYNNYLVYKHIPSVSRILNSTLPQSTKTALNNWERSTRQNVKDSTNLKELYNAQLKNDIEFHDCIRRVILGTPLNVLKENVNTELSSSLRSLENVFSKLTDVIALETPVTHAELPYHGIIDCIAKFNGDPVIIEWKQSDKPKTQLSSTYDAPIQMSAYVGAFNFDKRFNFSVKSGLIVVAYKDGSPADILQMDIEDCQSYWKTWLNRLNQYIDSKKV